jgi:hypothetical protein
MTLAVSMTIGQGAGSEHIGKGQARRVLAG